MAHRKVAVIGAPSSAGAYAPGQEKAPAAFRRHGLLNALAQEGIEAVDRGDLSLFRWRPDRARPKCMNVEAVRDTARGVADEVASALSSDGTALVLGGDCTVELGTVAGAQRDGAKVGLVYIDLDVDLNPPHASDGALDWTGVAHLLGLPGTVAELRDLSLKRPMLAPENVLFFAADAITSAEAATIEELSLSCLRLAEVQRDMSGAIAQALRWAQGFDRVLVHVDVDVLSYVDFPIAENVRRCPGLTLEELARALRGLLSHEKCRALTVAEVNPDHAPDEAVAFESLNAVLARSLAAKGSSPGFSF